MSSIVPQTATSTALVAPFSIPITMLSISTSRVTLNYTVSPHLSGRARRFPLLRYDHLPLTVAAGLKPSVMIRTLAGRTMMNTR